MITITLGTISFPFNRVIDWLEVLLREDVITDSLFIQHGHTDPQRIADHPLVTATFKLPYTELMQTIEESSLVISHAGDGLTRELSRSSKPFAIVPRLAKFGEHTDDHQLLFAESLDQLGVSRCKTFADFKAVIQAPPPPLKEPLFAGPDLNYYLLKTYPPKSP